jgi:acyl-CoA thioester hydrolase
VGKMEMFRDLNLPYDSRLPMVEAHCDFKSPARFDEILEVHTYVPETYEKGFKIISEVYKIDDKNAIELAKGYTIHITTDSDRNPIDLPDYFKKAFDDSG